MGAAASWIVPSAIGALGLFQSNKQGNAARNAGNAAIKPQNDAQNALLGLANSYNPQQEDQKAIAGANQNATATFQQSLKGLNGNFLNAGGSPTGDTAFNVNATNAGNRAIDPLRAFTTQLLSSESQRKADMYSRVFGAPAGQIANSYFQQAAGAQADGGNAMAMFLQGLKSMPWFAPPAAGSGYTPPAGGTTPNPSWAGGQTFGFPNQGATA